MALLLTQEKGATLLPGGKCPLGASHLRALYGAPVARTQRRHTNHTNHTHQAYYTTHIN